MACQRVDNLEQDAIQPECDLHALGPAFVFLHGSLPHGPAKGLFQPQNALKLVDVITYIT
jgi:hypothetical protein